MSYKETLFLPKTDFAMKANLSEIEPKLVQFWKALPILQQKKNVGKKKFLLHSGPPFANGRSHLGHLLNFILKDATCRYKYMQNYDVSFYWGWDCHGLPIEVKVEQEYKEKKLDLSNLIAFRQSCRDFASHWIEVQKEDLMKIGLMVNSDEYYSTMDYKSESAILSTFFDFVKSRLVYRDVKPVFWSVAEKTAFAEAEVVYVDNHVSQACYVTFPVQNSDLCGAEIVIWTTTPWTLPCNRAICYSTKIQYCVLNIETFHGQKKNILIAENLVEDFIKSAQIVSFSKIRNVTASELSGLKCFHPLKNDSEYTFDIPLLEADHVTDDVGTGFVHTAPSHGVDDFMVCKKNGIHAFDSVNDSGLFSDLVEKYSGQYIFKAIPVILQDIADANNLLHSYDFIHKYPYSWRSNTPLIFRTTAQWFIRFDDKLREVCLREIDNVKWIPEQGKNRIRSMVENRPDWCVSRQRLWGVPLFLFVHKHTNEALNDEIMMKNILEYVAEHGLDICFTDAVWKFLPKQYDKSDFYFVRDVIDVWFESGATHKFVTHDILGEKQADLYLEGSDQHRGWFQSSLIASCALNGYAPYKNVLTHGFLLDEKGLKISKSKGNAKSVEELLNENGADILRLWALSCDSQMDMRIGNEILARVKDVYRKIRNVIRYLLGAISDFSQNEKVDFDNFCALEKFFMCELMDCNRKIINAFDRYEFQDAVTLIHNFCTDISANYFDLRKDSLYCDDIHSIQRRSARTMMSVLASYLIRWIAPILPFTAENAWQNYLAELKMKNGDVDSSVHLESWPCDDFMYSESGIFRKLFEYKKISNIAMEKARNENMIGGGLTAALEVNLHQDIEIDLGISMEDFFGVSQCKVMNDKSLEDGFVLVKPAQGEKCDRCWKIVNKVISQASGVVCDRCAAVVSGI